MSGMSAKKKCWRDDLLFFLDAQCSRRFEEGGSGADLREWMMARTSMRESGVEVELKLRGKEAVSVCPMSYVLCPMSYVVYRLPYVV
jgi:hypothetical protein